MRSLWSSLTAFAAVLASRVFVQRAAPSSPTRSIVGRQSLAEGQVDRRRGGGLVVDAWLVRFGEQSAPARDGVLASGAVGFRNADRVVAVAVAPRVDVPSNRDPTRGSLYVTGTLAARSYINARRSRADRVDVGAA
ncbi:hypothetical protein [Halobellus rarus]|nr:hypothetical protein [Halobellus rarus]